MSRCAEVCLVTSRIAAAPTSIQGRPILGHLEKKKKINIVILTFHFLPNRAFL